MMWVPGFPADYDEWAEHAGAEWDYAHLRPILTELRMPPW